MSDARAEDVDRKRGLPPRPLEATSPPPHLMDLADDWPERFRSKVQFGDGCWEWSACRDANGYGRYGMGRTHSPQVLGAHRLAFMLTFPDVPLDGLVIDHLCRNPSCVRPDHLEPVTQAENLRRGRQANVAGVCRAGLHDWIPENITTEPPAKTQPDGVRRCRLCRDDRERRYRPPVGKPTSCPSGHEFTPDNTRIRRGHRECIECTRVRARRSYWRKKREAQDHAA